MQYSFKYLIESGFRGFAIFFLLNQKILWIILTELEFGKKRDLPKPWPDPQKYAWGCVGSGLHVHASE